MAKEAQNFEKQIAEVWALFKATDRRMQETDRRMAKSSADLDRRLAKMAADADRRMQKIEQLQQKTDQQLQINEQQLNKLIGDHANKWGALGENLLKGPLVHRLQERGIAVTRIFENVRDEHSEFDIIADNGKETVVVEVKCTLDPEDVDKFTGKMENFTTGYPDYRHKKVYGAMAFLLNTTGRAIERTRKQGFFVLAATGDVVIKNKKGFQPRCFS